MANLSFDPVVGEEVHTPGHYGGPFKIVAVHSTSRSGLGTVDLRQVGNDYFLPGVPWSMLLFDETRPVRRAIEWLRENPVVPFPDYVLDYHVEARDDHQGNPAFYIRFIVEPDDQPSPEKIRELNRFLNSVSTMLLSLGLDRWPYVQVSEKRSLIDVAS
jgi:hypothetical protein